MGSIETDNNSMVPGIS